MYTNISYANNDSFHFLLSVSYILVIILGVKFNFLSASRKCWRRGFSPWVGVIPGEGNGNPPQYSCLGNLWTEEPGGLQPRGSQKVRHDQVIEQP